MAATRFTCTGVLARYDISGRESEAVFRELMGADSSGTWYVNDDV